MRSFLVLLLVYSLSQFYRSFLAIVSTDLARDIGVDAAELGVISATWFIAFAIMQFPAGIGLDRFGPRLTLCSMMLAAVVGALWLSLARSYLECVAAMALIGTGCAPALVTAMYVFAQEDGERDRFASLSSAIIGLGTLGNIGATTPLAHAVAAFGWRGALLGVGALTLAGVALAFLLLPDPPAHRARERWRDAFSGLLEVARLRELRLILPLIAVSYAVVIAIRSLWIAPFLREVHGLEIAAAGQVALGMAIAMVIGALAFGPLDARLGHKKATLLGAIVTTGGLVALGLFGRGSLVWTAACLCVIGAAGMTYAVLMAHGRDFVPRHLIGRGVTFMNFVFIAGAGALQLLSGSFVRFTQEQGWVPVDAYAALHLGFAVLLAAATLVYLFAPARPRPQARAAAPSAGLARRAGVERERV